MEETYIDKRGQLMTTRDGKPYALQTKTGKEIKHKTQGGYGTYSCRCDDCTDAHAAANRKIPIPVETLYINREAESKFTVDIINSAGLVVSVPRPSGRGIEHGTRNAYRLGCRCLRCAEYASSSWQEIKSNPEKHLYAKMRNRSASAAYAEKNPEKVKKAKNRHRQSLPAEYFTEKGDKYRKDNPVVYKNNQSRSIEKDNARNEFTIRQASRQGLPFTAEEDALLLTAPETNMSLALSMSRGLHSIRRRRTRLRKKLREQGIDPDTMQSLDNQD